MEKFFSDNLGDLYEMQRLVQERQQEGLHYVAFDYEANKLAPADLHFFERFEDLLILGPALGLPNPAAMAHTNDFQQSLGAHIEKIEEKLMQPMDKLIQEINSGPLMSPEIENKYFEKLFQQDIQQQMGQDLGNVYTHLIREQQDGKQWVAYPDIEKVGKDDLKTFNTKEEALEFAAEKSNVAVVYDFNLIEKVVSALDPMVREKIDKSFGNDDKEQGKDKDKGSDKGRDEEMER